MTSCYHGSKISGSQQSFLTDTAFALSGDERKVWATILFLSGIMHSKVIFLFISAILFAGPGFVEIQICCYHGNVM